MVGHSHYLHKGIQSRHEIFSKGHNSKMEITDKKKNTGQLFFPWGIHIWNFKTLSCMVHKIWHASDSISFFQRGITPEREIARTRKKTCVKYFPMRNPYIKFQNPSMHSSCTDGRTDGHTTRNPYAVNFFEVGGIKTVRGVALTRHPW